jgi:outer membrane protein assembly factor BamB
MTTQLNSNYVPGGTFALVGGAKKYELSDGSSWDSGAGSGRQHWSMFVRVETAGSTIRYVLSPPEVGLVFEQTDFDSGDHSAQGTLAAASDLVIEAQAGSTTAVLRGNARIVSNDMTWYGTPAFNFYSAIVGSVVPFEITYTIFGDTWTASTFSRSFVFTGTGWVDFAHPVSTPRPVEISILGPPRIPDEAVTGFGAVVRYENGVTRDVRGLASWTIDPSGVAAVAGGDVTVGTLLVPEQLLTLKATYTEATNVVSAEKQVLCRADDSVEPPGVWPMFQANARHTGYLPISVSPGSFRLKWAHAFTGGFSLNPVSAGEGKIFATFVSYFANESNLFALSARDGSVLWSKDFGRVFSVNPPSFGYGVVYVQTGDHASDTFLHAFDANTGQVIFKAPHDAQWERYFAPTLSDGRVFVNGGYYGGMYAFDAYSGARLWYATLPQYDQWTPAVDRGHAFAYVGSYTPGLYVKEALTGVPANYFVADPSFNWNGWSMNLAPVVGPIDDVLAIQDSRLISFNPGNGTIRWQIRSQFAGQPSLAKGRIYAIDGGQLVVLDEPTGAVLWSWRPAGESLSGPMIVTDSHVFASTGARVHAIDLSTHESVWSYAAAGLLAFADDTLYVASPAGVLTALAAPGPSSFSTVTPCRVVDTRGGPGVPVGGPALDALVVRTLQIAGNCGVPANAKAVSINVTITQPGSDGYVTVYPPASTPPGVSTVNYSAGKTRSNNAIVAVDQDGMLAALATQSFGTTVHLIVDVNGYFE